MDSNILKQLPIQNLNIQEDREEEEKITRNYRLTGTASRSSSKTKDGRDGMGEHNRRKGC